MELGTPSGRTATPLNAMDVSLRHGMGRRSKQDEKMAAQRTSWILKEFGRFLSNLMYPFYAENDVMNTVIDPL
jgi:hypothetical protein